MPQAALTHIASGAQCVAAHNTHGEMKDGGAVPDNRDIILFSYGKAGLLVGCYRKAAVIPLQLGDGWGKFSEHVHVETHVSLGLVTTW